jgi:hypothetical protein
VLTPAGVSQATELDYTTGTVLDYTTGTVLLQPVVIP